MKSKLSADTLSQFSLESATSLDSKDVPLYVAAGDIRRRLSENVAVPKKKFDVCGVVFYLVLTSSESAAQFVEHSFVIFRSTTPSRPNDIRGGLKCHFVLLIDKECSAAIRCGCSVMYLD